MKHDLIFSRINGLWYATVEGVQNRITVVFEDLNTVIAWAVTAKKIIK